MQLSIPNSVNSSAGINTLVSFFSRVNCNYKSKYLFTASIKTAGFSKFTRENRWTYFHLTVFAWQIRKERLMKKLRFVSDSKLSISYIVTGNNRINDFVPYMSFDLDDYCSFNGEVPKYAMMISGLGHSDLKIVSGFECLAYALKRISAF